MTIGIQSSFGFAQTIEIHLIDDNTTIPRIFNVERCIPAIPKSESGDIHKIETKGNCINIYSQENCVGQFIRLRTSGYFKYVDDMAAHRWEDDILVANEKMMVTSIGPCLEKCDPQNWAGIRRDIPTNVTFYDQGTYKGAKKYYDQGSEKYEVFLEKPNLGCCPGVFLGTATTTCVELHGDLSCGGNSVQLRPGYPNLHGLWWWGFHHGHVPAFYTQSFSLCGNTCPTVMQSFVTKTTPRTTQPPATTATMTTTTVLEERVTNQSNLDVHEKESNSQGDEQPSDSPGWDILLIILAILSVLGLVGFGGVYFFQRYRNVHLQSDQERYNVRYKL
ncbi:hypothetical protein Fcan01_20140 [Folsomia candida]|uniref:Uncharacterized protein n=1 Tax=Folsomia candida TaxID=158441 RepID=A0A226DIQ1_FOLCA|nr:hypothetical protein Fcan01_20140 [Folsomia candida]